VIDDLKPGDRVLVDEDVVVEVTGYPRLRATEPDGRTYVFEVPTTGQPITGEPGSPIWRLP